MSECGKIWLETAPTVTRKSTFQCPFAHISVRTSLQKSDHIPKWNLEPERAEVRTVADPSAHMMSSHCGSQLDCQRADYSRIKQDEELCHNRRNCLWISSSFICLQKQWQHTVYRLMNLSYVVEMVKNASYRFLIHWNFDAFVSHSDDISSTFRYSYQLPTCLIKIGSGREDLANFLTHILSSATQLTNAFF